GMPNAYSDVASLNNDPDRSIRAVTTTRLCRHGCGHKAAVSRTGRHASSTGAGHVTYEGHVSCRAHVHSYPMNGVCARSGSVDREADEVERFGSERSQRGHLDRKDQLVRIGAAHERIGHGTTD